ncbi:MAG: DEAD/DEAH box helicase [Demequinaceae bacterium]|nr:DEAD/DEAH box helicase [Demequinaceae bacterium]
MTSQTFGALGVPQPLLTVLAADGKEHPFPIQAAAMPDAFKGRDVLGRAKTGSGKTLAFALPMAARLGRGGHPATRPGQPRGLILAPTRELATQIQAALAPYARAYGLTSTTVFGGVPQSRQVNALRSGVDIIVACPGRLEDLMKQRHIRLDAVEVTVIDEADHMADLGFLPCVTRILAATPAHGQRLLFSATLDNGVDSIVRRFLTNAVVHSADDANSPVADMTHHVFHVDGADSKREVIAALASGTERRILFMRTKHHAKKLAKHLSEQGIPAVDLHGNLSQGARDRNLAEFGSGRVRVLVATDVAARGVHVDDVALVVHVDPPVEHKSYLHRSGRTARAGNAGDVVTLVLPEQRRDTAHLLKKASIAVTPQRVDALSAAVGALVGVRAPIVPYTARLVEPQRPKGRSKGSSRNTQAAPSRGVGGGGQRGGAAGTSRGTTSVASRSAAGFGSRSGSRPGSRGRRPGGGR